MKEINFNGENLVVQDANTRDVHNETRAPISHQNLREQITRRTGSIIRFRNGILPSAFQKNGWRCSFCCTNRTHEQVMFTAGRTRNGRVKPISWQWICSEHKKLLQ